MPAMSGPAPAVQEDDVVTGGGPSAVRGESTAFTELSVEMQSNSDSTRRFARKNFSRDHLDRVLDRPQIAGIAFSGTVGIGIFITAGEFIAISGSVGDMLAFVIAGMIVIGVMRSLAEMVSVLPVEGALMNYPRYFVDEALGFAVGSTYWLSQCISMACLTSAAARIANNLHPKKELSTGTIGAIILGLWIVTLVSNICGVRIYGNLERVVKHIKMLTIVALFALMIAINLGAGVDYQDRTHPNITSNGFPPGIKFDGFNNTTIADAELDATGISGSNGVFLAIWTATTLAMFCCQGGDLVIVAAGEARNPRRDLPPATRFMYLVPIICYILLAFVVGFNINYAHPGLYHVWKTEGNLEFPSHSPFILVFTYTDLAPNFLPKLFDGLFMFAAYTTANTALYASSRTLFSFSRDYGCRWMRNTFGKTSYGHTPHAAIIFSSVIGLLAFLGLVDRSFNQPIQSLSAFFTSSIACVYACECLAFLRFKKGLTHLEARHALSRDDPEYTRRYNYYRAHWQPTCAIVGLVGSLLIVFFSGWPAIYIITQRQRLSGSEQLKSNMDLSFDILGAYLGPVLFVLAYVTYKVWYRTKIVDLKSQEVHDRYFLRVVDECSPPKGWARNVWTFVK